MNDPWIPLNSDLSGTPTQVMEIDGVGCVLLVNGHRGVSLVYIPSVYVSSSSDGSVKLAKGMPISKP